MAVSALFSKINDLEQRLSQLGNLDPSVSQPVQQVPEEVLNRLAVLEGKLTSVDALVNKLADIESRLLPADLPQKVSSLEAVVSDFRPILINNVTDIKSLSERINHIETITMPHVLTRLENLENKTTPQ